MRLHRDAKHQLLRQNNMTLQANKGRVIVHNMERGEASTESGIVLGNDEGKSAGIRARWAQVWSKGDDITDFEVGQWIMIAHGRWTRGIDYDGEHLYMVDYPDGVLAASNCTEMPDFKAVGIHSAAKEYEFRPEEFQQYTGNQLGL